MSKYIIEVEDNAVDGLFKAKGFNTLVFDQNGLDKLQKYEEPKEEEKSWPQLADKYYTICGDMVVSNYLWDNDMWDIRRASIGNIFRTKEEAEFAVERLKVLAEMRKFAEPFDAEWDYNTYHYYIYYDCEHECLDVYQNALMRCGELYFESKKKARECIEAVGEDRIKKYYLGVE